jgi:rhodanese-related sulfurtransferase
MQAWSAVGGETRSYAAVGPEALCEAIATGQEPRVLDVRQELEWGWGTLAGSQTIFVADLPGRIGEVQAGPQGEPVWLVCSNGHRAAIAASLLDAVGTPVTLVGSGGVGEVRQRCGAQLAGQRG